MSQRGSLSWKRSAQRGFSLIELMIAMVLGLIVSGAAVALFFSNSRTYASTESLGRIQENARTAFELMARDVRESAGNACGTTLNKTANVLDDQATTWFANFNGGVLGYGGTDPMLGLAFGTSARGTRVSGTDALDLSSVFSDGVTVEEHNTGTSASIKLNTADHGMNDGDIVMVCDADHAAIFQIVNASPGTNVNITHGTGNSVAPGNCTKGLGLPVVCDPVGNSYQFGCAFGNNVGSVPCSDPANRWTALVAKLRASRWYVGNDGGTPNRTSLFQMVRIGNVETAIEVADGVTDMQLSYLMRDAIDYVAAAGVTDWTSVVAVRVELEMEGQDIVGTDGQALARDFDHTITIRNRAL
jgi:type IV pilus assembly protein PilW